MRPLITLSLIAIDVLKWLRQFLWRDIMDYIPKWIQRTVSRRGLLGIIGLGGLGLFQFASRGTGWARTEYIRVKEFLVRSIESTQRIDLKTWHLKIEGLVEKPLTLRFDEIQALPKKIQVKSFICVEGWGLDNQKWEGVHLKDIFSKVKISPKAKYVSFYATGGNITTAFPSKRPLSQKRCLPINSMARISCQRMVSPCGL